MFFVTSYPKSTSRAEQLHSGSLFMTAERSRLEVNFLSVFMCFY